MDRAAKKRRNHRSGQEPSGYERLREIIARCEEIPRPVREAKFARVDERVLDDALFGLLTQLHAPDADEDSRSAAMQRRSESLAAYLGKTLTCILITLPGVRYTIEVDADEERVVHWEWQTG